MRHVSTRVGSASTAGTSSSFEPLLELGRQRAILGDPRDGLVLGEPQRRLVRADVDAELDVTVPEQLFVVIVEEAGCILRAFTREVSQTSVARRHRNAQHADLEVVGGGQPFDKPR